MFLNFLFQDLFENEYENHKWEFYNNMLAHLNRSQEQQTMRSYMSMGGQDNLLGK